MHSMEHDQTGIQYGYLLEHTVRTKIINKQLHVCTSILAYSLQIKAIPNKPVILMEVSILG